MQSSVMSQLAAIESGNVGQRWSGGNKPGGWFFMGAYRLAKNLGGKEGSRQK